MPKCVLQSAKRPSNKEAQDMCKIIVVAMNNIGKSNISIDYVSLSWVELLIGKPWLTIQSKDELSSVIEIGNYIKDKFNESGFMSVDWRKSHIEIRFDMNETNYV